MLFFIDLTDLIRRQRAHPREHSLLGNLTKSVDRDQSRPIAEVTNSLTVLRTQLLHQHISRKEEATRIVY